MSHAHFFFFFLITLIILWLTSNVNMFFVPIASITCYYFPSGFLQNDFIRSLEKRITFWNCNLYTWENKRHNFGSTSMEQCMQIIIVELDDGAYTQRKHYEITLMECFRITLGYAYALQNVESFYSTETKRTPTNSNWI